MLSGKNIHKRFGKVEVLKGVDIDIQKGEIISIVGPSGSGKSTLLHILGTLDEPDAGHIEASGRKIEYQPKIDLKPAAWWRRLMNQLIDLAIILPLGVGLATAAGLAPSFYEDLLLGGIPPEFGIIELLYYLAIILIYYFIFETLVGRSPAKFITFTKVVMDREGTRPNWLTCLIRSAARLLPFEFTSFFAGRPVGWHDGLAGTIVVDSKVAYRQKIANRLSPKELSLFRNKHMGFVFQFHHLLPEFTALENVCIPGWLAGGKKAVVKKRAEELLTMLKLAHRFENKPNQLSGGEQQRVAVARALINNPDIIFADEPTGNLDSANAKELHQLFLDLRKQFGQTFLVVTHNKELAQLSDRVLHMKDGRIVVMEN